jgi:excisionase family DNA binding protein
METMATKKILTVRQAARAYGLPEFAVRNWCKRGEIRHVMSGTRIYLVPGAIEEFLSKGAGKH